jgi:hypothetical protein
LTSDREKYERTVDFLRQRRAAYATAFAVDGEAETMSEAYDRVFLGSTAGQMVLRDLARFCRAMETIYDPDPRKTDILIGRNEIWKRIQDHLNLTPAELYDIYGDRRIRLRIEQEDEDR